MCGAMEIKKGAAGKEARRPGKMGQSKRAKRLGVLRSFAALRGAGSGSVRHQTPLIRSKAVKDHRSPRPLAISLRGVPAGGRGLR